MGYSALGHSESDTTERLTHTTTGRGKINTNSHKFKHLSI